MTPAVTLRAGDAATVLAGMDDEQAQCIVTSPPYFHLRRYGAHPAEAGQEPTMPEYVDALVKVFAEARRVLRRDGLMFLVLGDGYSGRANGGPAFGRSRGHGHRPGVAAPQVNRTAVAPFKSLLGAPWRVALALIDDGWILRNEIIWRKTNPMPSSVRDRCRTDHEQVFMFARSSRYVYFPDAVRLPAQGRASGRSKAAQLAYGEGTGQDAAQRRTAGGNETSTLDTHAADDRLLGDVWDIGTSPYRGAHFATFPPKLVERCLLLATKPGDLVLDPYGGSGTTGQVAAAMGRRAFLIDLYAKNLALAADRVHKKPNLAAQ